MKRSSVLKPVVIVFSLGTVLSGASPAQEISVRPAVEKNQVYVGEPFAFQIQIDGSDKPEEPVLPSFDGFQVEARERGPNNSESVMIVNGRLNRVVQKRYILAYQLTAMRAGDLTIPGVEVVVEGRKFRTPPVPIKAIKPEETQDYKLRLTLSKNRCYVGEPIILTVTWYVGRDVRNFSFSLPILADERFFVTDPEGGLAPTREPVRLSVHGSETIAEKGRGQLDGRQYTTVTFRKVLVPREPGDYTFPEATVTCEGLVGRRRSRSLMDDFFSDDLFGTRNEYRRFVAPSNPVSLVVLSLPEEGRPANFTGLVGTYRISATAVPTEVNVGDPITLTLRISGSEYLKHVGFPPLEKQPELVSQFKIPAEMASGEIRGDAKVFTQTLRALNSKVAEIPPIELPYFDTDEGRYKVAKTEPIPLNVRETTIVTSEDVEGREATRLRTQLTAWREGIAFNYAGPSVLENQEYGLAAWQRSPAWLFLLIFPPSAFVLLGAGLAVQKRKQANPAQRRAKKALSEFAGAVGAIRKQTGSTGSGVYGELLEALRMYLGGKLGVPGAALTFDDVREPLARKGVSETSLKELQGLFQDCEAHQYAGGANPGLSPSDLLDRARKLVVSLDKEIGK